MTQAHVVAICFGELRQPRCCLDMGQSKASQQKQCCLLLSDLPKSWRVSCSCLQKPLVQAMPRLNLQSATGSELPGLVSRAVIIFSIFLHKTVLGDYCVLERDYCDLSRTIAVCRDSTECILFKATSTALHSRILLSQLILVQCPNAPQGWL